MLPQLSAEIALERSRGVAAGAELERLTRAAARAGRTPPQPLWRRLTSSALITTTMLVLLAAID